MSTTSSRAVTAREMIGIVSLVALFVVVALIAQHYQETLLNVDLLVGPTGMALYVFVTIVSIVAAPLSSFPLLPVAVVLWGPTAAALLSILGWLIGAIIAYVLVRKLGRPFAKRFVRFQQAEHIAHTVAGHNPFWMVLLLRMIIPVDILSYALGLFVPMSLWQYMLATAIGITPFAFIYAYATNLSPVLQASVLILVGICITVAYRRIVTRSQPIDNTLEAREDGDRQ